MSTWLFEVGGTGCVGRRSPLRGYAAAALGALALAGMAVSSDEARAGRGTATPPLPGLGALPTVGPSAPVLPAPTFTGQASALRPFTVVGFLQNATVSGTECPGTPSTQWGGTAVVNGLTIIIPCNSTVQMPAATYAWSDLFDPTKFQTSQPSPASLTLVANPSATGFSFPSNEITIQGNIVNGRYIAGLAFISQQSLNTSSGYITQLDYDNGVMLVSSRPDIPPHVRVQINDARGRFSKGQSPDTRFNVDDENPTIRATTGYPMCIPRTDPLAADDPLCPQRNRPLAAQGCRNFAAANVLLPSLVDLSPPVFGQTYCSAFVMGNPATRLENDPDPNQQAPFEVGDFITFSGTLLKGDGKGPNGSDTLSAHTIVANVGIFTEPGTLPAYIAIGEFGVGPDASAAFLGIPQEAQERLFLEAFTTDVLSIVDIYMIDVDPSTGAESHRWVTPYSMTGGAGSIGLDGTYLDGGITTQFTGPVPGRVRLRAGKTTPGMLASPSRYMRVVMRTLCDAATINGQAPLIKDNSIGDLNALTWVDCLARAPAANGLMSGQYLAPVTGFIFPENVTPGDPLVPFDFWHLGFLIRGEGPGTGPLKPTPW